MDKIVYLVCGGALGTLMRYMISGLVMQRAGGILPWGTFVVNMIGCFLVGLLDALIERRTQIPLALRLVMVTGFCGAFTTFSALIMELDALGRTSGPAMAVIFLVASFVLGWLLFKLGAGIAAL